MHLIESFGDIDLDHHDFFLHADRGMNHMFKDVQQRYRRSPFPESMLLFTILYFQTRLNLLQKLQPMTLQRAGVMLRRQ